MMETATTFREPPSRYFDTAEERPGLLLPGVIKIELQTRQIHETNMA